MVVIARALRAGTVALVLAGVLGCDDERRPPRRPGQHWSHPVGNPPQQRPERPRERHFKSGHDRSPPPAATKRDPRARDAEPTARSEGELDTAAPVDAGAKQDAGVPAAADETFVP
jgi:hypothetical protein